MAKTMTLKLNGKEYTEQELQSYGKARLDEVYAELISNLSRINTQMENARGDYATYGESADWEWYKKAKTARSILIRWKERIDKLKREQKPKHNTNFEFLFVECAREIVPPSLFKRVMDATHERMHEEKWLKDIS
jgi:hypothetical protein